MITYIKIHGFKSFHHFEMEFTPLTVIAGINASGKSNLFDALKLLSRLASTELRTAFNEQRGNPAELFTMYGDEYASEMHFVVEMLVNKSVSDNWGGEAELKYTRLRYELKIKKIKNQFGVDDLVVDYEELRTIKHLDDRWIKKLIGRKNVEDWRPKVKTGRRGTPYIYTEMVNGVPRIIVPQDGTPGGNKKAFPAAYARQTVLSNINSVDFPHVFAAKREMQSWNFLQLDPRDLREPTRQEPGMQDTISPGGKNLAAALFRIKREDPYLLVEISRKLNSFLPNFVEVDVVDDQANQQYLIRLKSEDGKWFSSRVLSEGTLRLLALCVLEKDEKHSGLLCFEEPENGIHPSRIRDMAHLLRDLSADFTDPSSPLRQIVVNTHSPVLIGEMIPRIRDKHISIGLSYLKTTIAEVGGRKVKLKTTHIAFAAKDGQLTLALDENMKKLTLHEIKAYLETANTEHAMKMLSV